MIQRALFVALPLFTSACNLDRTIGVDGPDAPMNTTDGGSSTCEGEIFETVKNKVDVLFMVDNSDSMAAMANELKARFTEFIKVLDDPNAPVKTDLQIGVVTSDYGAGRLNDFGCTPSPGGQRGKLQAVGAYADASCKPPVGANFVHFDFATGTNNLPVGQDLLQTFTCMASVVTEFQSGCGFEHQLESVYAALHDPPPENAGFLRDGATLVVVFLTNEDDASAPPDTDVFDKLLISTGTAVPGCENGGLGCYGFEDSYSRQTRFAIQCDGEFPPYGDSGGPLQNCVPAPNPNGTGPGKQYDVQRYIDFFTKPSSEGGVKADPNAVLLVGIAGPPAPFQVLLSNPGLPASGDPLPPCAPLSEGASPPCVPVLQHSCVNAQNPAFYADPAVRLNAVITAAKNHTIYSICDTDYTPALQNVGQLARNAIGNGCLCGLSTPIRCTVDQNTINSDGSTTTIELPSCDAGPQRPCYQIQTDATCALLGSNLSIVVDRNGQPPPAETSVTYSCSPS